MGESSGAPDEPEAADGQRQAGSSSSIRTALVAFGSAAALAFTSVVFGWLPNPWEADTRPKPGLESLSLAVEQTSGIPATLRADESSAVKRTTTKGTSVLLTLRNNGNLVAVVTDFRITVKAVYPAREPCSPELPPTGGEVSVTGNFDVVLPDTGPDTAKGPGTAKGSDSAGAGTLLSRSFQIPPGKAEAVRFTLGEPDKEDGYEKEQGRTRIYRAEIAYREGQARPFHSAGTVGFMSPPEAARILLRYARRVPDSSILDCKGHVRRHIAEVIAGSDSHGDDLDALLTSLDRARGQADTAGP